MKVTIKNLLIQSVQYLKKRGVENNSVLDAQLILGHILKVDRLYLAIHGEQQLNENVVEQYCKMIEQRAEGMPVQYIIGEQEFMSLPFKVTPDVLIPRSDTEILVEHIIEKYKNADEIEIMDIGTGSGCIAVSLAYYLRSQVTAVDISPKALDIAQWNAKINGVENKMTFIQKDILSGFPENIKEASFDVIVSNPPYIQSHVIGQLQREVKDYEPRLALDGGADGLVFYRKIIREAPQYLKCKGLLALEVGHDQSEQLMQLMEETDKYGDIEVVKDLGGINRVVSARIKNVI